MQPLVDGGLIAETLRGSIYRGRMGAHELVRMDALVGDGVKLMHNGKLLETMDPFRVLPASPASIYPPNCGSQDRQLDKAATIEILRFIAAKLARIKACPK